MVILQALQLSPLFCTSFGLVKTVNIKYARITNLTLVYCFPIACRYVSSDFLPRSNI